MRIGKKKVDLWNLKNKKLLPTHVTVAQPLPKTKFDTNL